MFIIQKIEAYMIFFKNMSFRKNQIILEVF
jgi:hypothetical protein